MITTAITRKPIDMYHELIETMNGGNEITLESYPLIRQIFTLIAGYDFMERVMEPLPYYMEQNRSLNPSIPIRLCGLCEHCNSSLCAGYHCGSTINRLLQGCACNSTGAYRRKFQFEPNNEIYRAMIAIKHRPFQLF